MEAWKDQLVDVGGRNTLLYYRDLRQGTLDLRAQGSSEGAIARLLNSQTVRLSELYASPQVDAKSSGDTPGHLVGAARRARTVKAKATENFEERGIATLFLAWGMATWANRTGTATPAAPVLLREASLVSRGAGGEDFDVSLLGDFEINPTLVHYLATEFKLELRADGLLDLLEQDAPGTPDAGALFERLCKIANDIAGFAVDDRLVLGNFSYAKLPMVNDLDLALEGGQLAAHELLAAIAGESAAVEAIRARHPGVTADEPDLTQPSEEFLVLDADASQSHAINTAVRGGDLVVEGPPGTGKSQTIANLIATLAARGKRTLFVAEKRAAIDAVLERLHGVGLGHLVFDLHDGVKSRKRVAQELSASLAAAESVPLTDHSASHERLERCRGALLRWRDALHSRRDPWNASVYDLQAELTELRRTETIETRIDREVLAELGDEAYRSAAVELEDFAEQGGLELVTGTNPWSTAFEGRLIVSARQVAEVRDAVAALAERTLPRSSAELRRVAEACGLREPDALPGWEDVLSLVESVEASLGIYSPELFADADGLAIALAPAQRGVYRRAASALGNGEYRRARKRMAALASGRKDRPAAMLAAAVAAADQLHRWTAAALDGSCPQTADGLTVARGLLTQLSDEIRALADRTGAARLGTASEGELREALDALLADQATLVKLPELSALAGSLTRKGLWPVVVDVARRGFAPSEAVRALRFVWLASILDYVRLSDSTVGGFRREAQDRNVAKFRDADLSHLASTPDRVRRAVAERLVRVRDEHPQQSQRIRAEASKKQRHLPLRQLVQQAPDVLTALKPCWAMSPLVVAQMLPTEQLFDVVIFDEASQVTPADAVGALLRASTAVVAGDSKQLPPTSFFAASFGGGEDDEVIEDELQTPTGAGVSLTRNIESVLEVMRALLPPPLGTKTLGWHYRSHDERLIAFSNAQQSLYNWSLTTFPGTGVDDCIRHELIPWEPGRVGQEDSVTAEVDRVVELIIEHAETRPDESLGVIAMGIKHANRVTEALRRVRLDRPDIDQVLEHGPDGRTRPEPLFIKNLERVQGDERDAIILTIGYGRHADGRMLYRFGPLNQEGGERRLNVAITRARNRLTVVSSFSSADLDPNKLRAEGAKMLGRYLQYSESGGSHLGDRARSKPELNPFECDVRDALLAAGVPLVEQYGCSGYWIDFAAQHPTQPGRMVLAIEADGATYHSGSTARDRDRLRQEHLERLGWRFHRIWSTDWFHRREVEIERAVAAWRAAVAHADGAPRSPRHAGGSSRTSPAERTTRPSAPVPKRTRARPSFEKCQPIGAYPELTLVALADYIESDTLLRTEDQVLAEMMHELGLQRRGKNIVAALTSAIRTSRSSRRAR